MKSQIASYAALSVGLLLSACGAKTNSTGNSLIAQDRSSSQLLKGGLDLTADTVTLPLHQGSLKDGRIAWYVLTDTDTLSSLNASFFSALRAEKSFAFAARKY